MKAKSVSALILLAFLCVMVMGAAAGRPVSPLDKQRTVLGEITEMDKSKHEVVIKDENSNVPKPVIVKEPDFGRLKVGDRVKIVLGRNTNVAKKVILEN